MRPAVPHKTRAHLEWARVLQRLAEHCRGPVAEATALALDFAPTEAEQALRLSRVTEARALIDADHQAPIARVVDVVPAATRAARGGLLEVEELLAVGRHLACAARCRRFFDGLVAGAPLLSELGAALIDRGDLGQQLLDSFDEAGSVVDSASGELGQLRTRVAGLHVQLKESINGLLADAEYTDLLQDEYVTIREDRYVLPIKSGHKRHVPGIVHGWSASGATVYIEPQAVMQANNRLLMAQAEVEREVRRVLSELSRKVGGILAALKASQTALVTLDLAFAAGMLSEELEATAPVVVDAGLDLKAARHPLLLLAGVAVVPNDIALSPEQQGLVVTGPNTGGKTVALKTAGLCTLMALAGLHVPAAAGSKVPRVPGVFTDIGDEQSLQESKSTFSGHIANLMDIFAALTPGCMVLLDELVVGTDPLQGAALAQAIIEALADRGVLVLVTTHYEGLKALPFDDPRFRNGAVGYDAERRTPTYRLEMDVPGASSALQTARRLGLDAAIVDRAAELTGPDQRRLEAIIRALEAETGAAHRLRTELEEERSLLADLKADLEAKETRLRARLRDGIARERDMALRTARGVRDELDRIQRQLRDPAKKRDAAWIDRQQSRVAGVVEKVIAEKRAADAAAAGPAADPSRLKVGQTVWVLSLKNSAELLTLPDDRGRCQVRAGIMTAHVQAADLRLGPDGPAVVAPKKPAAPVEQAPALTWATAPPQVPDNTVDLRGLRAEEAVERAERFLDGLYERDVGAGYLIHGHGTGALKKRVRDWLRESRYARDWRAGDRHEGGDGVTAVLLA